MRRKNTEKSSKTVINSDGIVNQNTIIGCFTLVNSMILIIIIGLLFTIAFSILIIIYFRSAMLTALIPITVISVTLYGILRQKHLYLWPIIGLSLFHLILALYFDLFFFYYFIFKPSYIIMVYNFIFDTIHTEKTVSYYMTCALIMILTAAFVLFNLWQLNVMMNFKRYLKQRKYNEQPSEMISVKIIQDGNMSKY
uniref:Uncharacterized protein n=1 Tax=Onchocerca volvulus TaxID=6282 RepID=A0A8R1XQW3_ONCVO